MKLQTLKIKNLHLQNYETVWQQMRDFTINRQTETTDELWLVEHPPVFTQGLAGKPEHIINPHNIPIVQTDRGGQVTYHGPGQLVAYPLIDIRRKNIGVRELVNKLEEVLVNVLATYQINAKGNSDARGVYVGNEKIASIGLRIKKGSSYHGIALNVNNDLTPFSFINPCGYKNLIMTSTQKLGVNCDLTTISQVFTKMLGKVFQYQLVAIDEAIESV